MLCSEVDIGFINQCTTIIWEEILNYHLVYLVFCGCPIIGSLSPILGMVSMSTELLKKMQHTKYISCNMGQGETDWHTILFINNSNKLLKTGLKCRSNMNKVPFYLYKMEAYYLLLNEEIKWLNKKHIKILTSFHLYQNILVFSNIFMHLLCWLIIFLMRC